MYLKMWRAGAWIERGLALTMQVASEGPSQKATLTRRTQRVPESVESCTKPQARGTKLIGLSEPNDPGRPPTNTGSSRSAKIERLRRRRTGACVLTWEQDEARDFSHRVLRTSTVGESGETIYKRWWDGQTGMTDRDERPNCKAKDRVMQ